MSLKKISFLLVIGLLVQMSLALAVVNFRVVVPAGTTFVVGESSEVQVWLDVPAEEPLLGAEFNLNDDPLNAKLHTTDALTGGFFLPQPIVGGSNIRFGVNGWTFGEEIAPDGPLVSAPDGKLFATMFVDAVAPGESSLDLGGLSAWAMDPAGAGFMNYEVSSSLPLTVTVTCPSGQVPSADGESCVPGVADPGVADPGAVLDTLLTNIRSTLEDGSTSQLQKISALARLLRDYFAS